MPDNWPIEITQNKNIQTKTSCDGHGMCYRKKYIYRKICELNKSRMCVQYVTSWEPAQQAYDHVLIIANFFDSILCIVMFQSDAIKVFFCEMMPSNI